MEFYDQHPRDRDKFEILAFHDASVKSLEELDRKLESTVKSVWNKRTLPFPILLDSTGATIRNFGISAFPTTILIDPDGKIMKVERGRMLEQMLQEPLLYTFPYNRITLERKQTDRVTSLGAYYRAKLEKVGELLRGAEPNGARWRRLQPALERWERKRDAAISKILTEDQKQQLEKLRDQRLAEATP